MVYALPIHVCPTIALHEQVYVVEGQNVNDIWKVSARREIINMNEGYENP